MAHIQTIKRSWVAFWLIPDHLKDLMRQIEGNRNPDWIGGGPRPGNEMHILNKQVLTTGLRSELGGSSLSKNLPCIGNKQNNDWSQKTTIRVSVKQRKQ